MAIEYGDTHIFIEKQLQDLFSSVNWESGEYPDKLAAAMKEYKTVFSAWEGGKLVGLICAMDDGVMTAYVHYLLVDPKFQKQNIGRTLVEMLKEKYSDYLRIALVADGKAIPFYEKCGFEKSENACPMYINRM